MPNNREIAEWLREAATKAALLRHYQNCCQEDSEQTEKMWLDRAAIVEQMRCETCRWWLCEIDQKYGVILRPLVECQKTSIKGQSEQFSCCHWEGKK
jgi:hypothetical protein